MRAAEAILPPDLIDRLAEKIEAEMALSFHQSKRRDLTSALRRMAEATGTDPHACAGWLLDGRWDKAKADLCALHLTIGETYFFREPRAFDLLCDYARRKAKGGGQLRIWSAGCCTGEEAYSIAMALQHRVPELDPGRIFILATDINSRNLQFARAGVYRQWSFRNTQAAMQRLNFSEESGNQFRVNHDIRESVRFAELNLAAPVYPSVTTDTHTMDIIFCRNVLMYFSHSQARSVIERFRQCLVSGGWLIVSPSEASSEMFEGFSGTYYPDAIYFQKNAPSGGAVLPQRPMLPEASAATGLITPARIPADIVPAPARQVRAAKPPKRPAVTPAAGSNAGSVDGGNEVVRRARQLANEGKMAEAMQCLDQAIKAGPPAAELYHAKALIAMESGDDLDAMQSLRRVIYLKPDFILARYMIGILHWSRDKRREAAREFRTVAELLLPLGDDDIVPGSEGLPAAYLRASVRSHLQRFDA